mmetsp:Transcript_21842/g.51003  ORF Transcript_21842/g.51003 Transcript_21842/m.51003 type:complete len:216 (-) Transcript_21842:871-1518(-)
MLSRFIDGSMPSARTPAKWYSVASLASPMAFFNSFAAETSETSHFGAWMVTTEAFNQSHQRPASPLGLPLRERRQSDLAPSSTTIWAVTNPSAPMPPLSTGTASGVHKARLGSLITTLPMLFARCKNCRAAIPRSKPWNKCMLIGFKPPCSTRSSKRFRYPLYLHDSFSIMVSAAIFSYITSGLASFICSWLQMPRLPISMKRPPFLSKANERGM